MAESAEAPSSEFATMSFEEIMRLPKAEFIARMQAETERYYANLKEVGPPGYSAYTFQQKVDFWAVELNRQMRWQVESGQDAYAIFSVDWYRAVKNIEPRLDDIFKQVFANEGFQEWSETEYLTRITRLKK